jgi:hypothetical protein
MADNPLVRYEAKHPIREGQLALGAVGVEFTNGKKPGVAEKRIEQLEALLEQQGQGR